TIDKGADVGVFVQWIANAQLFHACAHFREKFVGDTFLDQQAGAGTAHLPLIEPDAVDKSFDCRVEISVFKDDESRFATQFKRKLFAGAGRGLTNNLADL